MGRPGAFVPVFIAINFFLMRTFRRIASRLKQASGKSWKRNDPLMFPKEANESFGKLKGLIVVDTEDLLVAVEYVGTTDHEVVFIVTFGFFRRENLGNDRGRGIFRPLFHSPKCFYNFCQLFHVSNGGS